MSIQSYEKELYTQKEPLVSAIITTKNEEKRLPLCLESIKMQTYRNIEIIVVDDYSEDNTVGIAKKYTPNVFVEDCKEKMPIGRKKGAQAAKGDIFLFVDAKVILQRDYVEKIVAPLIEDCAAAANGEFLPDKITAQNILWKLCIEIGNLLFLPTVVYCGYTKGSTAVAVTRKAYQESGGYNEEFNLPEDLDLIYKLNRYWINNGKFLSRAIKFVPSARGHTSLRRFEKDGYKMVLKDWFVGSLRYVLTKNKEGYAKKAKKYPSITGKPSQKPFQKIKDG